MMKKGKLLTIQNKSGVVLTTVMIMLLVMSIIISAVVFLTVGNLNKSKQTAEYMSAYYVAEGGINFLTKAFENKSNELTLTTSNAFFTAFESYFLSTYAQASNYNLTFATNNGKDSHAVVWITTLSSTDPNVRNYQLHSNGFISTTNRTLTKNISVIFTVGNVHFRDAILSVGQIALGNAKVYMDDGVTPGSISTNSIIEDSITIKNSAVVGDVYISDKLTAPYNIIDNPNEISGDIITQTSPIVNPITLASIPTTLGTLSPLKITVGSKKFTLINDTGDFLLTANNTSTQGNDISVLNQPYDLSTYPNNSAFTMSRFIVNVNTTSAAPKFAINVGENNYTIVTNTLWIEQPLRITGTGTLTIIVRQNLSSVNFTSTYSTTAPNLVPIKISSEGMIGNDNDNESNGLLIYVNKITQKNLPIQLKLLKGDYYFSLFSENLAYFLNGSVEIHGALGTNLNINSTYSALELWSSGGFSATLYYIPNGNVSFQSSSIEIRGAIVCKTFSVKTSNSPTIIYSSAVNDYVMPGVIDVGGPVSPPSITFDKSATTE
jgi:hypothetical protein